MKVPSLGLVMIVRNEETNLARCLDSVAYMVGEIVIVDTGSSDRTVEVARRYTERIYHHPWAGDFSAARNYALERAASRWILCLDADEELEGDAADLAALVNNDAGYEAFLLPLHNLADRSAQDYNRFPVLRLFRNTPAYRFRGRIHEQVTVARPEALGIAAAPVIRHRAATGRERNRKRGRNLALLRRAACEDPANPFLQYYLGVEWLGLGRTARALDCFQAARARLDDGQVTFRAPAVRYLVHCLKALGRLDEAICVCLEECSRYQVYADLIFDGGGLFELKGEYEVAVRWFREAVACGPPPLVFSHTNGTESFLALYHLGHCHERLGRLEEAKRYYEEALAAGPGYPYPAYSLFLLELNERGPDGAFAWLKGAGHLDEPARAAAFAELFFAAGCPDLARACLLAAGPDARSPENLPRLAWYSVWAGRPGEVPALVGEGPREAAGAALDLAVAEAVALLLTGDYAGARKKALALWRRPEHRGTGWTLLNLISLSRDGSWSGRPGEGHEAEAVRAGLRVLDGCMRCRPADPSYARLAGKTTAFLSGLSPRACLALADHFLDKARAVDREMDRRYMPARGLYL